MLQFAALHAGTHNYYLTYYPGGKTPSARYFALISAVRATGLIARRSTDPTTIANMLQAASRYGLHECDEGRPCTATTQAKEDTVRAFITSNAPTYHCEDCGKPFARESGLAIHRKYEHEEIPSAPEQPDDWMLNGWDDEDTGS